MTTPTAEAQAAVVRLIEAVAEREGFDLDECQVRINWGESEDYMRGFNRGYDDYAARNGNDPARTWGDPENDPPTKEPWKGAWDRGYQEGWDARSYEELDPSPSQSSGSSQ